MGDAGGILRRLGESGVIADRGWIEHHHVGEIAGFQQPAFLDAQIGDREVAEPAHCVLQGGRLFLANIFAEQPRDIAIGARVILAEQKHALRRGCGGVGAKAHPRQRGLALHIGLIHQEIGGAHPAAILDHQIDRGIFRAGAAHPRHFAQRLAGERFQLGILEAQKQHLVRITGPARQIFPIGVLVHHLGLHPGTDGRIFQPLDPLFQPARLHPDRHGRIQPGGAGGVVVHVGGDADAGTARCLDLGDDGVELAPVAPARHLHVPDFGWSA